MTAPDQTAEIPTPLSDAALNHVSSEPMITLCRKLEKANVRLRQDAERLADCRPCSCGDVGYNVLWDGIHEPEQEQCQFCYVEPLSRFNALEAHRALMAELDKERV